jgi:hypothetical protein
MQRDENYLHCLHKARRIFPGIWQLLSSMTLCYTKFRNVDGVDCIYEKFMDDRRGKKYSLSVLSNLPVPIHDFRCQIIGFPAENKTDWPLFQKHSQRRSE